MKSLLACALLALVPFSSLRMVCLDAHGFGPSGRPAAAERPASAPAATDEAADAGDECSRICARRSKPPAPPAGPTVTCLLIADPGCAFLTTSAVAVMPGEAVHAVRQAANPLEPSARESYFAPVLARPSPPPRS
jgi:hypothetical protein